MKVMLASASLVRRALPKARIPNSHSRLFSKAAGTLADVCNLNIVSSPFPPILDSSQYCPVPEFISADWSTTLAEKVSVVSISTCSLLIQRTCVTSFLGCYSRWEHWRDEDVFRLQQLHVIDQR